MSYINLLEILYPVGSVYLSLVDVSPSSFIGGTWVRITDGAALRCGVDDIGQYVGNDSCTLSIAQMPKHSHSQYVTTNSNGPGVGIRQDWNGDGACMLYYQCDTGTIGGDNAHSIVQYSYNIYGWVRTS